VSDPTASVGGMSGDNTWVQRGFIAFDTETTGVDVSQERIVTAAAVVFVGGQEIESREWLLKVDIDIPERATEVHGITNEISQNQGLDQREALADIRSFLVNSGLPVVCFNSQFDRAILDANLIRVGLDPLASVPDICPYVIDKQQDKYVKGKAQRRLQPTVARYGLEISEDDWHGALADSRITGLLLLAQAQRYPHLFQPEVADLAEAVTAWRAQQDREFNEWLARQPPRASH
jgi:DNA polymerase III subunit epsilon